LRFTPGAAMKPGCLMIRPHSCDIDDRATATAASRMTLLGVSGTITGNFGDFYWGAKPETFKG